MLFAFSRLFGNAGKTPSPSAWGNNKPSYGRVCWRNWIPGGWFVLPLCAWIICWSIFCCGMVPVRRGLCRLLHWGNAALLCSPCTEEVQHWYVLPALGNATLMCSPCFEEVQHWCVLPCIGKCSSDVFSLFCSQMQTTCPVHAGAASRCPELWVFSQLALELLIIVKIKGGSVCIVYSRKEQCKISSAAVRIPCYFWYLTSAEEDCQNYRSFSFLLRVSTLLLISYSYVRD